MKFLKILPWIVVVVVVLAGAAIAAVVMLVNPNDYKDDIAALVTAKTGRTVNIDGDLGLTFYPWLGLTTGHLSVANRAGFGDQPMLEVNGAKVRVALLPLLKKRVEVDSVRLDGPVIRLAVNKDGKTNWGDLAAAAGASATESSTAEQPADALAALAIQGVTINGGHIVWDDQSQGKKFEIEGFSLSTGNILVGKPMELHSGFTLSGTDLAEPLAVELDASVVADLTAKVIEIAQLNLAVDGKAVGAALHAPVLSFDLGKGLLHGTDLRLNVKQGDDEAKVQLGQLDYRLAPQQADLDRLAADLSWQGQALTAQVPKLSISLTDQTVTVPQFSISHGDLIAQGSLAGKQVVDAPRLNGHLQTAPFNLHALLAQFKAVPRGLAESALTQVVIATDFEAGLNDVSLNQLAVTVGGSHLTGAAAIHDFAAPAYRFRLAVDRLDLDVMQGESPAPVAPAATSTASSEGAASGPAPAAAAAAAAGKPATALPMAVLRQLDVDGQVRLGELVAHGIHATDVRLALKAKGGRVAIDSLSARLYAGTLDAKAAVDATGDTLINTVHLDSRDVDLGALLKDAKISDKLGGTGHLKVDLTALGSRTEQIERTSNGIVVVKLANGYVRGFDIGKIVRQARALRNRLAGKQVVLDAAGDDRTDFSELSGTFKVTEGLVSNDDLDLKAPLFRVTGEGEASLPQQSVDYVMNAAVVDTVEGQGGKDLADLKGITVPIRARGPLGAPKLSLDVAAFAKSLAEQHFSRQKEAAETKVEKQKKELQEKAGSYLDRLRKKLLDQQGGG